MEIIHGGHQYVDECVKVAEQLPEYFTGDGVNKMRVDLVRHELFVVRECDEILGFASIHTKTNCVAEIPWLAIHKEHQNRGIGKQLIGYVGESLRNKGLRLLEVKTLSWKAKYEPYEMSRRFYESMGFILLETIDPFLEWGLENPCDIYVKIL